MENFPAMRFPGKILSAMIFLCGIMYFSNLRADLWEEYSYISLDHPPEENGNMDLSSAYIDSPTQKSIELSASNKSLPIQRLRTIKVVIPSTTKLSSNVEGFPVGRLKVIKGSVVEIIGEKESSQQAEPHSITPHVSSLAQTTSNDTTTLKHPPLHEIVIDSRFPPVKLILLRAIGNPLPPRHDPEQAYQNLKFTLEHEYDFPHLTKVWVMNRLVDPELQSRLEALLRFHGREYFVLPFNLTEYAKEQYRFDYFNPGGDIVHNLDYIRGKMKGKQDSHYQVDEAINQDKNLYVTNQNAARNAMIQIGQTYPSDVDWILPWDGNCFLHPTAYQELYQVLQSMPLTHKYAFTSMNRAVQNEEVLEKMYTPRTIEEPQVIFHKTAQARYHPKLRYGRRNKVELLQRLKVTGPWDNWSPYMKWEERNLGPFFEKIPDLQDVELYGPVRKAGFVTRLSSGQSHLEVKGKVHERGKSRMSSMSKLLGQLDVRVAEELYGYQSGQLIFYHESAMQRDRQLYLQGDTKMLQIKSELKTYADKAVLSGPWSVTHKPDSSVAISGDKHDYFHRSPYYWPKNPRDAMDPNRKWVRRDGKRYPGTGLHEAGSENFDRTRLKDMQYNTTILGLAYYMTGEAQYAEVAARNIRTWFLDSETRMNPHMRYAQVMNGHNNNTGISFGIIEMKDLYFMLDAVRIIEKDNFLTKDEQMELRSWFQEYLTWLETSEIGQEEYSQKNNHGLYFDIQALAIASFVNDTAKMIWYAERSTPRLLSHIEKDGSMPQELQRPTCEHYQMFTLQGWSVLSRMADTVNRNRWKVQRMLPTQSTKSDLHGKQQIPESLPVLCQAAKYAIPMFGRSQKCQRSIEFREDITRWWPLYLDAIYQCPELIKSSVRELPISWFPKDARHPPPLNAYEMPSLYNPHDGIAPFWNLGLSHPVDFSLENAEISPAIKM